MIPIEQKAPPGDRTAAEWNHVAKATRRRRRILRSRILSYFIGKTASGALLNEKGPRGGGHENGTVVKLEDIKTFCSPIVIIVIEFM